ncbi:MAG: DNA polymerase III subunit delta [Pseudorhodobacter sp.]|nr:DNA polymerase III subunit delta [Pseudorhodobacter sp.]
MKLAGAEASRYLARPDAARPGLMIFGADPMRVALKRQEAIAALVGPNAEAEMRLTRMPGAALRKDATLLLDAVKAMGFFPGPRVAFVEDATDTCADALLAALQDWRPGDAVIVVTAGNLSPKSLLKNLMEKHPSAVCIGLYDEPPSRDEVEALLQRAGLSQIDPPAMAEVLNLSRALDPGDFRQTLEKISLYKHGDPTPLTLTEVADLAPGRMETDVMDVVAAAVDGKPVELGLLMRRIEAQGVAAVTLCIQTLRYLRALHVTASDPGGGQRAYGFGNRQAQMQAQASRWGGRALEQALALLVETDLTLRSTSRAPAMAVMERALIGIAMMKR